MKEVNARVLATVVIWLTYLFMVATSIGTLGAWSIGLAFVLMMPLAILMGGMWGLFRDDDDEKKHNRRYDEDWDAIDTEKRKRDRIDRVLRDLSDDQLERLSARIQTGDLDDDALYERLIGDDGEMVIRPRE